MTAQKNILVTGAGGQLGQTLRDKAVSVPGLTFHFFSRQELPIDNRGAVTGLFSRIPFDYCINTAAYTAVDKAESEPDAAFAINATAAGQLAGICRDNHCRFIHISTDYVFDGRKSEPYAESDPTSPAGIYGASKLRGEQLAIQENPTATVIRTSWVFSEHGHNFVKTMIRLMNERHEINVVNDQQGSPTYAADLADCILAFVHKEESLPGIFHYCNAGVTTWYDFAVEIKRLKNLDCQINPVPSASFPAAAKRPANSVLSTQKISTALNLRIPAWQTGLERCLKNL